MSCSIVRPRMCANPPRKWQQGWLVESVPLLVFPSPVQDLPRLQANPVSNRCWRASRAASLPPSQARLPEEADEDAVVTLAGSASAEGPCELLPINVLDPAQSQICVGLCGGRAGCSCPAGAGWIGACLAPATGSCNPPPPPPQMMRAGSGYALNSVVDVMHALRGGL